MEAAEENFNRFLRAMELTARLSAQAMRELHQSYKQHLAEIRAAQEPERELNLRLTEATAKADRQIAIAYMNGGISKEDRDELLEMTKQMQKHSSLEDGVAKLTAIEGLEKDFERINLKYFEKSGKEPYPKDLGRDMKKYQKEVVKDLMKGLNQQKTMDMNLAR